MTYRIYLLIALLLVQGCSSCDDGAGVVDLGGAVDAADAASDSAIANDAAEQPTDAAEQLTDAGEQLSDAGLDGDMQDANDTADMGKPPGPRAPLQYRAHRLVQESRVSRLDVATSSDGFFMSTGTAGNAVVWSLGEADEQTIDTVFPNTLKSVWAHYDNNLNLRSTRAISSYPGGPRAGGTSSARSIELEPSGDRLMAGEIMGSIEFGGTVWSTTFATIRGALTTATEGYVVRSSDASETALFRLRTQNANDSVYLVSMVRHDDGDLTLGGWFNGTMFLPDGSTLSEADGPGFVIHTGADGTPKWVLQTPGTLNYVDGAGDKLLVRMRIPGDVGFRFDGIDYLAPTLDWCVGMALVDADGSVDWFRRIEATFATLFVVGSAPLANGGVVIVYRGQNEIFPDVAAAPDSSGDTHLIAFAANGDILWNTRLADEHAEYRGIAVDSHGIAWTVAETCADDSMTLKPKWSPDVVVPICGPPDSNGKRPVTTLLLGYDTATGELGYAQSIATGSVTVDLIEVLADESVMVVGTYFSPVTVMPGTANEEFVDGLLPGPSRQVKLLLIME